MDQVALQLLLDASRADAQLRKTAALGERLFERRGFKINVSTSGLPLGRITGDFDNFRKSLDAATARVTAFTATTGIIYGLADAFRRLFTESVKLEKQLASIQSILRVSGSELRGLSNDLLSVANATSQSFDVAVEAATEFSRQGLTLSKTIEATNAALALSRIAGIDAADAVSTLTATINTFNNEGLEYQDILDTIISLDNSFAASASGIADGLKRIGSVASEAGIELKEIASLITVVQQVSARGETVISNGLKTILTRLNRSNVQEALGSIGIQTQTATGEFRSQIDVLTDLANKQDSLSDSQRAYINETVAGVFQINTLQSTLKSLGGEYSLFNKAVQIAGSSAGDTAARLRVLNDTASSSLQVLSNNLARTFADLGSKTVLPILKDFTALSDGILKIFQSSNIESIIGGIDTRGIGQKIGEGVLDGIASFLNSSGKVLLLGIVAKLFGTVLKDIGRSVLTLSDVNKNTFVNKELQDSVNKAIATGNRALVARLVTTTDLITKNQILNQLLQQQSQLGNLSLTNTLVTRGLNKNGIRTKAKGFIPALLKEKKDIQSGVGGASRNAQPLIRELNIGRGKEKVVVNSDELLIENYLNSGKDAIFNQDMIRDAGGIEALRKTGKIKNFASGNAQRKKDLTNRIKKLQDAYDKAEIQYMVSNPRFSPGDFDRSTRGRSLQNLINKAKADLAKANTHPTPAPTANRFPVTPGQRSQGARLQLASNEQDEIDNFLNKEKKKERRGRLSQVGLGVSVGLPLVANSLINSFGGDSEGSKRAVGGVESASSGLAVASLLGFTPIGVASGLLVATLSAFRKETETNIATFNDLKKNADKVIAANQEQINSVQGTIQAQNQLGELIKSNASAQDRSRARDAIVSSASKIDNEEIRNLLLSGDNSSGAQAKLQDFQLGLQKSSRVQEGLLVARGASEKIQKDRIGLSNLGGLLNSDGGTLGAENFSAIVSPLVDAIDLTKISAGAGAIALEKFAKGSSSAEEFITTLGESSALTAEIAAAATKEFKIFGDVLNETSKENLNKYIASQIKYKESIQEISNALNKAENVSIGFKKAFDASIGNILDRSSFNSFKTSAQAKSNLGFNKDIVGFQQETGSITSIEAAGKLSKITRQESDLGFSEKSNAIFQSVLTAIVEQTKTITDPKKQGKILEQVSAAQNGQLSLTDLNSSIKKLVGTDEDSVATLSSINAEIIKAGKDSAQLLAEQTIANDDIVRRLDLQIAQLSRGPGINDVLGGKTAEARKNLLNPVVDADLTKSIKKLDEKIKLAGVSSKEGQSLAIQRDSLVSKQQTLRQNDLEARKALLPGTDPKLSADSEKQKTDILSQDFYKTNGAILRNALEEIDAISRKTIGGAKFGAESINKNVALLESGQGSKVAEFLQGVAGGTGSKAILGRLEEIFNSPVFENFSNVNPGETSVTLPKSSNLKAEEKTFLENLNRPINTKLFSGLGSVDQFTEINNKLKSDGDAVASTLAQIANIPIAGEKNAAILASRPGLLSKNGGTLGPELVNKLSTGKLSQEFVDVASDKLKSIIKEAGFVIPKKEEGELKKTLEQQQKTFDQTKQKRDEALQNAQPQMEELRKAVEALTGEIRNSNEDTGNKTTKIEQDVSLAVDVRGVDSKLMADIKSSLTTVIDARIKEIVKDTFNVAAVTKPVTATA